ncbi:MAG: hypothetical protein FWC78_06505 [Defluviitaleaceae bacterium]|nr:hypothetical protein [Defluviitaleaceae bacterium]
MLNFLSSLTTALNQDGNHLAIVGIFLGLIIFTVLLRLVTYLHFRATSIAMRMDMRREVKKREDISRLKCRILRKITADYVKLADRNVSGIPLAQMVSRNIAGMSLFGWRYENIIPLVQSLETGLLFVGLVLAVVFPSHGYAYGLIAVGAFIITRVLSAFFSIASAKNQLAEEAEIFIATEIGRHYASNTKGAVVDLKTQLIEAVTAQTEAIIKSLEALKPEPTETDPAPLNEAILESAARLDQSSSRIQSASDLLATHMKAHSEAQSQQLLTLISAINSIKDGLDHLALQQKALTQQANFIEKNQQALEQSLEVYESTLQGLAQTIGDGLGTFINIHAQSSAKAVNDTLQANMDKLIGLSAQGVKPND